ncbi:EthD family reductase [Aureisphaera sp.]
MNIKTALFFLLAFTLVTSCQNNTATSEKGMIKVTILYPNADGKTFDMDYYSQKHMPMLEELFGDSLKKIAIDEGLGGRTPDESIPFLAIGYLYFDTLLEYQNSFGPHAEEITGDIPNYTNIRPIVQISRVLQ